MGTVIAFIGRVLRSLTKVFQLDSFHRRITSLEGGGDALELRLDKRFDERGAEVDGVTGSLAERISYIEGHLGLRK